MLSMLYNDYLRISKYKPNRDSIEIIFRMHIKFCINKDRFAI